MKTTIENVTINNKELIVNISIYDSTIVCEEKHSRYNPGNTTYVDDYKFNVISAFEGARKIRGEELTKLTDILNSTDIIDKDIKDRLLADYLEQRNYTRRY